MSLQLYSPDIASEGGLKPFFIASLPLPPSVNESYKIVHVPSKKSAAGAGYKVQRLGATAKLEAFKQEAAYLLATTSHRDMAILSAIKSSKRKTPLSMHMQFYFPTMWQKDLDGGIKAVQDAVFLYLQLNDNLVVFLSAAKSIDAQNPRVVAEVSHFIGR